MHEEIKRFYQEGIIADDKDFIRLKDEYCRILEDIMRDEGCIPVLDLKVDWTTEKRENARGYNFRISMYGVFVGEDKECEKIAYSDGKIIQIK